MAKLDSLISDFAKTIKASNDKKTTPYDTPATVTRVDAENRIVWVHIDGGVEETPVRMTVNAEPGDNIQVRVSGGTAWIMGNATSPPTSDAKAIAVQSQLNGLASAFVDNSRIVNSDIEGLKARNSTIEDSVVKNSEILNTHTENFVGINSEIEDVKAKNAVIENAVIENSEIIDSHIEKFVVIDGVVQGLQATDAVIQGKLTAAEADIGDLKADKADIDLLNVNNAWIENGVMKKASVFDENVFDLSGDHATLAKIDASKINVANLNADNLIVRRINGQPVVGGYTLISPSSPSYSTKNPQELGWYEFVNAQFVLSTDTTVDLTKAYYQEGNEVSLYDQTYIDNLKNGLQQQIDGAVETFTGTTVPTLVNYPYTDWYDTSVTPVHDERARHVGDIYYVINEAVDEDGYCYRFAFDETTHSYNWVLIKDSAVTRALADISDLQTFESNTTSWIEETDEGIETIRTNHTALSGRVDGIETTANAALPASTFASFESTTFADVVDEVDEQSTKLTNMTTALSMNADGTSAETDIIHRTTNLEQNLDGITTRVGKTETKLIGMYATSSTAKGTAAKVATITPAVTGTWELTTGTTITVKFTAENTTASPTLNVNSTGAKPIKTYSGGNLAEAEYKWKAGSTFSFVYDGTNWRMQDSSMVTRISSAESSITHNAENITLKVSKDGVISSINQSPESVTIDANRVNIAGAAIFSSYSTTEQMNDAISTATSDMATNTSIANTYATKANAVKRTQRIYYQNNSTTAPSTPGTASSNWVTDNTSASGKWTKKRMSYSSDNKYIWTCEQSEKVSGTVSYTTVLLDDSTTVIDGGNIITGTVTANQIAAHSIGATQMAISDHTNLSMANELYEGSLPTDITNTWKPVINSGYLVKKAATQQYLMVTDYQPNNFNTNDELYFEFYAKAASATPIYVSAWGYTATKGGNGSNSSTVINLTTTETKYSGTIELANAGWNTSRYYVLGFNEPSKSVQIYVRKVIFRRKNAGELIVDGSITANKITVDDLSAIKAKIGTWDIVGRRIESDLTSGGGYRVGIQNSNATDGKGAVFYAGTNTAAGGGIAGESSSNFYVRQDGYLYCNNAKIKGNVTMNSGTIADSVTIGGSAANTLATQTDVANLDTGLGIKWNTSTFAGTWNAGEAYFCSYDSSTGAYTNEDGWVMFNGVKRTVPKGCNINPDKVLPYNTRTYIVLRLSSATDTEGTLYYVYYSSGWKSATPSNPPVADNIASWTWAVATDIVLCSYVEPGSEAALVEYEQYTPVRTAQQITTGNTAYQQAATAQTTANNAAKTATNYLTTISGVNGITVHNASDTNNFAAFNSNGMQVYKGGNTDAYKVATIGDTITLGTVASDKYNTLIDSTGMKVRKNTTVLASFGTTMIIGDHSGGNILDGTRFQVTDTGAYVQRWLDEAEVYQTLWSATYYNTGSMYPGANMSIGGAYIRGTSDIEGSTLEIRATNTISLGLGSADISPLIYINGRQYGKNYDLWSGGLYMSAGHTTGDHFNNNLTITDQPNGVVLAWSAYASGAKDYDWVYYFIPKRHVQLYNGTGVGIPLCTQTTSGTITWACKYVYVYNNKITGYGGNNQGNNAKWVLRRVIGV